MSVVRASRSFAEAVAFVGLGLTCPLPVFAADAMPHEAMHHQHAAVDHDHAMQAKAEVVRTIASYEVPEVTLTDYHGEKISLRAALGEGPVMVNFIYTSCSTICPTLSDTFSRVQKQLAVAGRTVRMVSISIDPEYDTPARLKAYAEKFSAGAQWQFLTGNIPDILAVQRAFDVYRGSKMNHAPITFLRAGAEFQWIRLDGFSGASELIAEVSRLIPDNAKGGSH